MTTLPPPSDKKLGLVIDLDICVGCQACVVNCKEWNTAGYGAPLADDNAYGNNPVGSWLNRVHTFEAGCGADARVVHFPKSCLHCEDALVCLSAPRGLPSSAVKTALSSSMKTGVSAAGSAPGPVPMVPAKWTRQKVS